MAQMPLWRELEVGPSLPQRAPPPSYPLGFHRQVKTPLGLGCLVVQGRKALGSQKALLHLERGQRDQVGSPQQQPGSGDLRLPARPSLPRLLSQGPGDKPAPSHLREAFPSSPALHPGAAQAGRLRGQMERGGAGGGPPGAASATSTLSRAVLQWGRLRHPGPCRAAAGWNAARGLWLGASGRSLASLLAGTSHSSSLSGTGTCGGGQGPQADCPPPGSLQS